MPTATIYINLEDDVSRIASRLKKEKFGDIVLVCPKRCFLFSDSINLKLLKKQADLLGKTVSVLTMDEKGQMYSREAGFNLKSLPKKSSQAGFSDIAINRRSSDKSPAEPSPARDSSGLLSEGQFLGEAANSLKKIFISSPPKIQSTARTLSSKHAVIPKISATQNFYPSELDAPLVKAALGRRVQRAVIGMVVLSVFAILGAVFFILPQATVAVYPKTEPVTRDMDVSASTSVSEPSPADFLLPAQKINETMELSDKFQTQGKKEVGNKARGTVRVYNFTKQPLNLKANTTVLTVGDKSYHLVNDIQGLKITAYKNQSTKEVDEATLGDPVEIIADRGGEASNLPAGVRMEITNQVFGSKPQFLFAKTETAILGGTSRYLSVVSQQDIDYSRNTLGEQIIKSINDKLKAGGLYLIEKAYTVEVIQFTTDKPAGTETPGFNASLKAKITGLAYSSKQLKQLVIQRITQTLSANKSLEAADNTPSYKLKSVDLAEGRAVLAVHFEGQAVMNVGLENMAQELVGKNRNQVTEILRSKAEIDRIDITLAPSWQKIFPFFKNRIKISLQREIGQ